MSRESPMIRRVRPGNLGFRFPKRGRIRFLVTIVVVIFAFKFTVGLLRADSTDIAKKDSIKTLNDSNIKSGKEHGPDKKKHSFWATDKKSEWMSFADVSELLKNNPPRLTFSRDTIVKDGDSLVVYYSIDTALQRFSSNLVKQYHPKYGAITTIDPVTGRVLALVSFTNPGERDFGSDLYGRSIFPAASIFKTITAAAAIEKADLTAESQLAHVGRNHTLYKFQLVKELKNYTEIPLEEAFAKSINPIFARIGLYLVGNVGLDEYGKKFGFNTPIPFELQTECSHVNAIDTECTVAELASGFNRTTTISPMFGALLASTVSEDGKMPSPTLVDSIRVLGKDSSLCIYRAVQQIWRTPIKESTAGQMRILMGEVARSGTARKSFKYMLQTAAFSDYQYGGKTGSVDKDSVGRVDWFIGYARDPINKKKRIATGVVTIHGDNWTVHSSYIGAEEFRVYLRKLSMMEKAAKASIIVQSDSTYSSPQSGNGQS